MKKLADVAAVEIGARIKAAREDRDLTLKEATRLIWGENLAASRLSNYEQGLREPDANTIQRIASVFGVQPNDLMFGKGTISGKELPVESQDELLPNYVTKALQAVRSAHYLGAPSNFFTSLTAFLLTLPFANAGKIKPVSGLSKPEQEIATKTKKEAARNMHHEGATGKSKVKGR